jgi:hypothetical protein
MSDPVDAMQVVCERYGAAFVMTPLDAIVSVAQNVGSGALPVNGLRHAQGETSGWFLSAGAELSDADDFFEPIHARHLADRCPDVMPLLGLAPGWRFLIAPNHEDVWFDAALLNHDA